MSKTQEAILRVQVDNLSLEVERQNEEKKLTDQRLTNLEEIAEVNHTTIMQLQSQNLQLTAVVQNLARFLKAGEDDYDILDPTNAENLRNYILTTMEYNMTIDMPTPKVTVHGVNHD